jgi:hypothetical protein
MFKTNSFIYSVIILINFILYFSITLNTKITFITILLFLLGLYLLTYLVLLNKKIKFNILSKRIIFIYVIPTFFNLFFFINYIFASNSSFETYYFEHDKRFEYTRSSGWKIENTTYIFLENDAYSEYYWFRIFFDYGKMNGKNQITYKFKEGLFGIKVLKDYKFGE